MTLDGLDDARRVVSDEGVIAVGRKQLALSPAVGCERFESFHASNGQTAGHVFGFAAARGATQGTLATSASLTQRCSFSSLAAFRSAMASQRSESMMVAAFTLSVMWAVTENHAEWRTAVPTKAHP